MNEEQYTQLALKLDDLIVHSNREIKELGKIKEAILSDPLPDTATGLTTAVDELNQSVWDLVDVLREGFSLWVAGGR